jgi:hypothetical protein
MMNYYFSFYLSLSPKIELLLKTGLLLNIIPVTI